MPRHTSSLRPPVRPQEARHDHTAAKARRAQRLAAKNARKRRTTA